MARQRKGRRTNFVCLLYCVSKPNSYKSACGFFGYLFLYFYNVLTKLRIKTIRLTFRFRCDNLYSGIKMEINAKIKKLKEIIDDSFNIVFFGGAGVSTESGVPDFRSKDGLYNNRGVKFEKYPPEYLLSHGCITNEPEVFFEFYRQKMDTRNVKPNAAHYFLADLEKTGKLKAVITQNIDGLHQKAGSKTVYELHGTTLRNYCAKCGKRYSDNFVFDSTAPVPLCPVCGGTVRCDVTLYEEALPEQAVNGAINAIANADALIIGGTSLTVYPAASFIRYFRGKHLVVINKDPLSLQLDPKKDLEINAPIGEVFSTLNALNDRH